MEKLKENYKNNAMGFLKTCMQDVFYNPFTEKQAAFINQTQCVFSDRPGHYFDTSKRGRGNTSLLAGLAFWSAICTENKNTIFILPRPSDSKSISEYMEHEARNNPCLAGVFSHSLQNTLFIKNGNFIQIISALHKRCDLDINTKPCVFLYDCSISEKHTCFSDHVLDKIILSKIPGVKIISSTC